MNKQHLEFSAVLTAKEAGARLKVSLSWLAKARMRGDARLTSGSGVPSATPRPRSCSG
jgi:hypothetical protein